jgi:hypothetical protein
MGDIWQAGEEVYDLMRELIAKSHPQLALIDREIFILFREKAGEPGGVPQMSKVAKIPEWVSELDKANWKFKIELAGDIWKNLAPKHKEALMDHCLCACQVEEKKDGSLKWYTRPPDVVAYQEEIERHGVWCGTGEPGTPHYIMDLFGKAE